MKDWKQQFREMFPHGIYELPEFVNRVTGVSPRGDEYVGMAINKEDIENFISKVEQDLLTQLITECEGMKRNKTQLQPGGAFFSKYDTETLNEVITLLKNKRDEI